MTHLGMQRLHFRYKTISEAACNHSLERPRILNTTGTPPAHVLVQHTLVQDYILIDLHA